MSTAAAVTVPDSALRVAAAQITSTESPEANLRLIDESTAAAVGRGAQVVLFPEASLVPFSVGRLDGHAQPLDGPFADGIREIAQRHHAVVVVGMFTPADTHRTDEGDRRVRVHNTLLATGPGTTERAYRKIHLYDAFGTKESDTVAPGKDLVTIDVDGWTLGLATCFDVRYPEQFVELARLGAHAILLPASWGDGPGKADQWDLLTAARAADSQTWLLACGQAWTKRSVDGPFGIGRSALIDPTGAVRARLGGAPDLLVADLDPAAVQAARDAVPLR